MPELEFHITDVRSASEGLTPLMVFDLQIENQPAEERIQSVLLQTQIRIESTRRRYSGAERERLVELFGPTEDWNRTLRDMLWTSISTTVPAFVGGTSVELTVPCTYDLNIASAKYFYGIDAGDIPLIFLFTGTIFYWNGDRIQIQRVSWECEGRYRMPVERWKALMNEHYPNSVWMVLERDAFDRLYAYKQNHGLTSWGTALSRLLDAVEAQEVVA